MATMTDAEKTDAARSAFLAAASACGSTPQAEEEAVLNISREFLPDFAVAVLDETAEPTAEYWDWLRGQIEKSRADRDEVAGRESTE